MRDTPSKNSWEDDDGYYSKKKSSWDTPKSKGDLVDRKRYDGTPAPTPSYKYNKWADDRKKTGVTPQLKSERNNFSDNEDFEEDQKVN